MAVARLLEWVLGAMFAAALLAAAPASALTRLEPCRGITDGSSLISPYGANSISFVCDEHQTRHGPGDYLVEMQFNPIALDHENPQVFRMTSVWQDAARLRFHYADGSTSQVSFTSKDASRYLQYGAIYEVPVPFRHSRLVGLDLSVTNSANLRGIVLGAALMSKSESQNLTVRLVGLYAGFAGLALALIAYNIALWAALRHRFQLYYCAMVGAILLYVFTSSGAAMQVFPLLANNDRLRLNYVLLALAAIAAILFLKEFFGPQVVPRWLRRCIVSFGVASLVGACAFAVFAPTAIGLLDRAYFLALSATLVLVFPVLGYAWRSGNPYFWMFVLAWGAPVVTSVGRMLHVLDLIGYSFWLDNGNMIALSVEALASSVLITARLRDLSSERDLARAGERSALRLANSDSLTGLLNRRAFIQQAIGREGSYRLLLVDIDHFKAINDRHGHDAGDQVLVGLAQVLQAARPPGSLAVRLGGEEFALLIPTGKAKDCDPGALLAAIRSHPMPMQICVTASMGVAEGTLATEADWKRLYRLADAALYRAKADGRDRFCRSTNFAASAAA